MDPFHIRSDRWGSGIKGKQLILLGMPWPDRTATAAHYPNGLWWGQAQDFPLGRLYPPIELIDRGGHDKTGQPFKGVLRYRKFLLVRRVPLR